MKKRSFVIHYEQWLEEFEDRPGWSEKKEISVKVTSDALTSRWLAGFDQPIDYLVLTVIGLHARPMTLDDIEMFMPFGLVTQKDVGRLFTYVTNETLAIELDRDPKTIAAATYRLAQKEIITVRSLPKPRASHQIRAAGKFKGNKIFILSGDIAIKKEVEERTPSHRVQNLDTVEDSRIQKTDTVGAGSGFTVSNISPNAVQSFRTNIEDDLKEEEGEEHPAPILETEAVRALFAEAIQKENYELTVGDLKAIARLNKLGATLDEVRRGIYTILDLGKKPKTFAYCVPQVEILCQERQPNAKPNSPQPTTAGLTETATEPLTIPEEIKSSVDIFKQLTGNAPTSEQITLMLTLVSLADEAAGTVSETGAQWLYAALNECSFREGIRSPLRYAAATIRNRVAAPDSKKNGNGNGAQADADVPEVALYRSVTGLSPRADQVEVLVEKLSGKSWSEKYLLTFWREWCARDHKRHNLGWLDWAQDGYIPKPVQRVERKKTVNLN